MKKLLAVFALLAFSGIPTLAQHREGGTPLFEVNAGYTFMRWQNPPVAQPPSSTNYNGFNAGGALNFTNWAALALDVSGVYNTSQGVSSHIYSYLAGPRIYPLGHHKLTPYVHGLVGAATFHIPGALPDTETHLSFEIGGGVDWSLGRHFAVRLGQFDYQQTRFLHSDAVLSGVPADNQNNFKYSAGLVIRFGEK